jgi:hypothetical protein
MPGVNVSGSKRTIELRREDTYGVFKTTAGVGDICLPRILGDDSWRGDVTPESQIFRSADAGNRPIFEVSSFSGLTATLNTVMFSDLLPGATAPPNDFASWILAMATDISGGDLRSFSVTEFDGVRYQRSVGWKVRVLSGTTAADQQGGVMTLRADCMGQRRISPDPTGLVAPAYADYPILPYRHIDSAGQVIFRTSGSSVRGEYRRLMFTITNDLEGTRDELAWISGLYYNGRSVTGSCEVHFQSKADRDAYEARNDHIVSFGFTRGARTLSLDFKGRNKLMTVDRGFPLGRQIYETLNFQSLLDPSATTDFGFAVA